MLSHVLWNYCCLVGFEKAHEQLFAKIRLYSQASPQAIVAQDAVNISLWAWLRLPASDTCATIACGLAQRFANTTDHE